MRISRLVYVSPSALSADAVWPCGKVNMDGSGVVQDFLRVHGRIKCSDKSMLQHVKDSYGAKPPYNPELN